MKLPKKKRPGSLLALTLDAGRLSGAVVRASGGSLSVQNQFAAALTLDPLTHEAELVGREIRNHLESAGIRERRCSVCLPLNWALTLQTKLPDIPAEDVPAFLQIEAERGFPYGLDALLISESRFTTPSGDRYVTQVAVPREHAVRLEAVLKAAKLVPLTFSLGIPALQAAEAESSNGVIAIVLGEDSAGLQVSAGGGVASLRILESAFEVEGADKRLQSAEVAREIRITLGQLPAGLSDVTRRLRIFGRGDLVRQLADELRPRVEPWGLRLECVETYAGNEFRPPFPAGTPVSAATSLAARYLTSLPLAFDFLPPKISVWQQLSTRYSSKKLVYAGASVGALALVVILMFAFQEYELSNLGSKWQSIQPRVTELENLQGEIRKYRPWFGEPARSLNILRELTLAFPEDGSVTAKTIEIRDQTAISCLGTAKDNAALFKVLDKLRAVKDIYGAGYETIQGKSPIQFTIAFHWGLEEGTAE